MAGSLELTCGFSLLYTEFRITVCDNVNSQSVWRNVPLRSSHEVMHLLCVPKMTEMCTKSTHIKFSLLNAHHSK